MQVISFRTGAYQDGFYKIAVAYQRRAEGSPPYNETGNL